MTVKEKYGPHDEMRKGYDPMIKKFKINAENVHFILFCWNQSLIYLYFCQDQKHKRIFKMLPVNSNTHD